MFCILIVAFISRANSNVLSLDCFVLYFAQLELSFHFIVTLTAFYFVYYVYISPIKLFFHFDFFFCILRKFNFSFIWFFLLYLTQLKCPFFIVTFVTRANLTVVSLNCCVCIMHKLAVLSFHCYFSISRKFSCSFLRLVFTQAALVLHQIFYDY